MKKLPQLCPTPPPTKIARRKRAKSSITQPWIIRFRSNVVEFKHDTRSVAIVQVQAVKGQGHSVT